MNKIVASILLASLIAMIVATLVDVLYKPELFPHQRGYQLAVTEGGAETAAAPAEEVKVDIPALMKLANAEAGANIAKKCIACHSLGKGEPNKIGPNLWGVVDSNKGSKPGYNYSAAILAKGGKWDVESIFHLLHKPREFLPGTKMTFAGLSKPEDIANVVAYLETLK